WDNVLIDQSERFDRTLKSPPVNWHIEAVRVLVECQLVTEGCLLTMTDGSG
ncbi:hypothetical protein KUCAC02_035804, partial [Chaenocephalus aceratus]